MDQDNSATATGSEENAPADETAVGEEQERDDGTLAGKIGKAMAAEETDAEETSGERQPEQDGAQDDGKFKPGELEGLKESAQEKVNQRIHELNVRRKNAEERATQAEQRATELEEQKAAVDATVAREAYQLGIAPEYVKKDELDEIKQYERLRAEKHWLIQHRQNGYEGAGTKEDPSLSPEEVAMREAQVDDLLYDVGPRVKTLVKERQAQMLKDMQVGREFRLKSRLPSGKDKPAVPPNLPASGKTASKAPLKNTRTARKTEVDDAQFKKDGSNKNALMNQFKGFFGATG